MRLIIIGGGGMAIETAWYARDCGYEVAGYLADEPNTHFSAPYLGRWQEYSAGADEGFVIAIGNPKLMGVRAEIFAAIRTKGWHTPNIIHPSVVRAPSAKMGNGNIITPFCIISEGVTIGDNNLINNRCSVTHDDIIGSHNVLSPLVTISGAVRMGDCNFIGSCACLFPGLSIGSGNIIQSGVMLQKSLTDGNFVSANTKNLVMKRGG